MEQYEMFFTSIKNELLETEGWVVIDLTRLKLPLEDYLRTGRVRKVDTLLDNPTDLKINKDLVRLDLLQWLSENKLLAKDQLSIWELFISEKVENE